MKKIFIFLLLSLTLVSFTKAQNLVINGSFENNTATGNVSNLTGNWPLYVSDSYEVDGGTMDLITSDGCGTASVGNWFVRTSPQSSLWPYLAFSLRLSSPLIQGTQYNLSFDKKFCGPNSSPIDIGVSNDSTFIGNNIHTFSAPLVNSWITENYSFPAPATGMFLTVNVGVSGGTGQVALDNFILTTGTSGIAETKNKPSSIYPNPFSENITIQNVSGVSTIEIISPEGITLWKQKGIRNLWNVNLEFLASGMYFLKISDAGHSDILKIVKE